MSSGLALEVEGGRWKRYPAYRDSGIEWLGAVPEGWDVIPLRWNSRCSSGDGISSENIETIDDEKNVVPVIGGNGIMGYTNKGNVDYPVLAIGRVGALCGNVHVVQPPAWITDNALAFDADAGAFDLIFLAEVLRSRNLNEIASKTAQPLITGTQVRDQRVPHPPIEEQRTIAAFLDRETGRIDALVAKKERQIDLLHEKRTALISHAVTKGLDPDAPMKDSGVGWLGEVPEHWNILALRRVVSRFVDYRGKTPEKVDRGVPLITAKNIKDGHIDLSQSQEFMREDEYQDWMTRRWPEIGDVLITTEAPLGEVAQVEDTFIALAQRIILLKVNKSRIINDYLKYHFLSMSGQGELWTRASGSTAVGIKAERFKGTLVSVPPINEQQKITRYLDGEISRSERPSAKIRESITKLREYRTALISAAVTGKIDVREELVS